MPMSLDAQSTLALQREFARHLRDPQLFPPPDGLEERRLQIYRELFYNNIEGLLATNFPVIRRLLGDSRWHRLVRDFYREHTSHTPLFTEIGREFQRYLDTRVDAGRGDLQVTRLFLGIHDLQAIRILDRAIIRLAGEYVAILQDIDL